MSSSSCTYLVYPNLKNCSISIKTDSSPTTEDNNKKYTGLSNDCINIVNNKSFISLSLYDFSIG